MRKRFRACWLLTLIVASCRVDSHSFLDSGFTLGMPYRAAERIVQTYTEEVLALFIPAVCEGKILKTKNISLPYRGVKGFSLCFAQERLIMIQAIIADENLFNDLMDEILTDKSLKITDRYRIGRQIMDTYKSCHNNIIWNFLTPAPKSSREINKKREEPENLFYIQMLLNKDKEFLADMLAIANQRLSRETL